jgi:dTDP-4-dehydrorhamnose reductase
LVTKENGIRFVFISTDQLFDGQKPIYSELDEVSPINVYARTKAKAEKEVLSVNENTLVIRTNFFGWGTSYRSSFSDLIISSLRNNKPVFLFNDVFYTPILVQTLVECIEKLININQKGLFNIVGDEKLSKYDFGMEVAEFFELNHKLIHSVSIMERRDLVVRPHNMSLSNHKVTSMTDISIGGIKSQLILMKKQLEFKIYKEIQFL